MVNETLARKYSRKQEMAELARSWIRQGLGSSTQAVSSLDKKAMAESSRQSSSLGFEPENKLSCLHSLRVTLPQRITCGTKQHLTLGFTGPAQGDIRTTELYCHD
jgi:hypothetical protein